MGVEFPSVSQLTSGDVRKFMLFVDTWCRFHPEVSITSYVRTPAANAAAGGVSTSLHLEALAIDFDIMGAGPGELQRAGADLLADAQATGQPIGVIVYDTPHKSYLHVQGAVLLSGEPFAVFRS